MINTCVFRLRPERPETGVMRRPHYFLKLKKDSDVNTIQGGPSCLTYPILHNYPDGNLMVSILLKLLVLVQLWIAVSICL